MAGTTHWLWCFAGDRTVFYKIDRSRGSPALQKFFTRYFDGVLITDFWSPYDGIDCADRQKCRPHLLRDVACVDDRCRGEREWDSFCRRLMGVYRDARRLQARKSTLDAAEYEVMALRLEGRLIGLGVEEWTHREARRLKKVCAR